MPNEWMNYFFLAMVLTWDLLGSEDNRRFFLQCAIEVCTHTTHLRTSNRYTFFSLTTFGNRKFFFSFETVCVTECNICNKCYSMAIVDGFESIMSLLWKSNETRKQTEPTPTKERKHNMRRLNEMQRERTKGRAPKNWSELKRIEHKMRICAQKSEMNAKEGEREWN